MLGGMVEGMLEGGDCEKLLLLTVKGSQSSRSW